MAFDNNCTDGEGLFSISSLTVISPSNVKHFTTVILFCVNVPVLSEQIIFTEPNVSTAGNFLIIALRLDIAVTPIDRTTATIAVNPSGIEATANDTDVKNISAISLPCN